MMNGELSLLEKFPKGVFASVLIEDVEKGLLEEDEDKLQPLLTPVRLAAQNGVEQDGCMASRPIETKHEETKRSGLRLDITAPSSVASTTNNTPATDAEWPRKWRRSDRRLRRLNTELLEAIEAHHVEEVERLLKSGANPNATCRLDLVSACHMAALTGGDALELLLKHGAEKNRQDRLGRTPLHLATWKGHARQVAILLDFPEDMQCRVDGEDMSSEAEEDIRKLCPVTRDLANTRSDLGEVKMLLPKIWKDNIDHNCRDIKGSLPVIQPGWSPLHVASACARRHCTRLLLAAGALHSAPDTLGRTPLDVVGSAFYYNTEINTDDFAEVIRMLLKAGGSFNTMKFQGVNHVDTPLHTAVLLDCLPAITELLEAGATICCLNTAGQTPLHVCVQQQLEDALHMLANNSNNDMDPLCAMVDVKDSQGHTVLQAAIAVMWVPGVCITLEAGADVTLKDNDGETPIHFAAALGNIDVFNEIISVAKQREAIDAQNAAGETALFKAVTNGHVECVEAILNVGASMQIQLPGGVNILHVAAEHGHYEVLRILLTHDESLTSKMINTVTAEDRRGFGPIHFAVSENHIDCVELLLSKNADLRLRTTCSPHKASTPLHIAAVKNNVDIAKIILNEDKTTIHEVNSLGWFPLHSASHFGSRDVVALLLAEGANLSGYTGGPKKFRHTAIEMILNNFSKPTEFIEDVFDSYISTNSHNLQDVDCVISVDYRILMPTVCEQEQMKVMEALLKTGNRYGQRRLLIHPLVESFLWLKWKALLPFFYTMIFFYAMFLTSLTIFLISVYFYKDSQQHRPAWLNPEIWAFIVCLTVSLVILQELFYMNVKSSRYFRQYETWIKFASLGSALIILPVLTMTSWASSEWSRHVATVTLLLSWIQMMFLLSRFPNWGYYVLMFGKVAWNVVKILLTFGFLVVGFTLSFMIQFRSKVPFEDPWAALVKTIVMMTSEFDYGALFDEEHIDELAASIQVVRFIFLVFIIFASIVLMNLLVGVAVNDINDLEVLGNIQRLAKQVQFLSTLDTLVYNKVFQTFLPRKVNDGIKRKRNVVAILTLRPGTPKWRHHNLLPSHLLDTILNKAQTQKKQKDDENDFRAFKKLLSDIHGALVNKDNKDEVRTKVEDQKPIANKTKHEELIKCINTVDENLAEIKKQITTSKEEAKTPLESMHVKIDQMSLEIESIKMLLSRLESKIGRL